jgi:hypothetical protein
MQKIMTKIQVNNLSNTLFLIIFPQWQNTKRKTRFFNHFPLNRAYIFFHCLFLGFGKYLKCNF